MSDPNPLHFEVTITATGEVRDADGNLIETVPVTGTTTMTAEQVAAMLEGETP